MDVRNTKGHHFYVHNKKIGKKTDRKKKAHTKEQGQTQNVMFCLYDTGSGNADPLKLYDKVCSGGDGAPGDDRRDR